MNQAEKRAYSFMEIRAETDSRQEKIIEGHAAVFGQKTKIGECFYEVIERGAFPVSALYDVALLVNHDAAQIPLARTQSGTMELSVDDKGLAVKARLDVENNPSARSLYSAVERGDLRGMSFAFSVDEDEWQDLRSEMPTRRIKKIKRVYDVSVVTLPAYSETDINARAANTLATAREVAFLKSQIKEQGNMMNFERYTDVDERTAAINSSESVVVSRSADYVPGQGFIPAREGAPNKAVVSEYETAGKQLKENRSVVSPYNAIGEFRAVTLEGTPSIVVPTYTSGQINQTFPTVSTLIDSVAHLNLNGGESYRQPFVISIGDGGYTGEGENAHDSETVFGYADINRAKVTAYAEISEELAKLPAAAYADTIFANIRTAMRQVLSKEIMVGKGLENNQYRLVGIFSDKATAIDPATDLELSAIDDHTLDDIVYHYGGAEDVETQATLILSKQDLLAFSKVRTATNQNFYTITLNGNSGSINSVPFVISSACKPLTATSTAAGEFCMAYGSLSNYSLVEFTPLDVKRSDDFKFRQGLIAFRGSVFVGGNVTTHNGFLRIKRK